MNCSRPPRWAIAAAEAVARPQPSRALSFSTKAEDRRSSRRAATVQQIDAFVSSESSPPLFPATLFSQMSWRQHVRCLARKYRLSQCLMANKQMNGILVVEENHFFCLKLHRGYASSLLPSQTDRRNIYLSKSLNSGRKLLSMVKLSGSVVRNIQGLQHPLMILWVADRKMKQSSVKRRPRSHRSLNDGESGSYSQFFSKFPPGRHFSGASVAEEKSFQEAKPNLRQPLTSQSVTGILQPSSPEEVRDGMFGFLLGGLAEIGKSSGILARGSALVNGSTLFLFIWILSNDGVRTMVPSSNIISSESLSI
nr:altered inheritance rate of mitochondria protein 25 [Ipomoea batatas]